MTEAVSEEAVALSLILEALSLLDHPRHSEAADYLKRAIEALGRVEIQDSHAGE